MEATLHMPTNDLKPKVPSRGGKTLKEIVANAEAALANMEDDYEQWVTEDVRKITGFLTQAKKTTSEQDKWIKEIHVIGHNIKGQAATFNFPLLTSAAHSLCHFIQEDTAAAGHRLDLIEAHVDTMRMIISGKMKGSGGKAGQGLVSALEGAVEKVLSDGTKT